MKKIICITLLVFATIIMSPLKGSAAEKDISSFSSEFVSESTIDLSKDVDSEELTVKTISEKEYKKKLKEMGLEYKPNIPTRAKGVITHKSASWVQAHPKNSNYKAYMTGLFEVYVYDSFREIRSASVGSGLNSGLNSAAWKQTNKLVQTKLPSSSCDLSVVGHFTASRSTSVGGGASIPGFSVSSTIGTTTYYVSTPMTISKRFSLY